MSPPSVNCRHFQRGGSISSCKGWMDSVQVKGKAVASSSSPRWVGEIRILLGHPSVSVGKGRCAWWLFLKHMCTSSLQYRSRQSQHWLKMAPMMSSDSSASPLLIPNQMQCSITHWIRSYYGSISCTDIIVFSHGWEIVQVRRGRSDRCPWMLGSY